MPTIPGPPETSDPITWIALTLVAVLLAGVVIWLPRLIAAFREDNRAALQAFRDEIAAERKSHEAAVAVLRADDGAAHTRLHERLDSIEDKVTTIVARGAA